MKKKLTVGMLVILLLTAMLPFTASVSARFDDGGSMKRADVIRLPVQSKKDAPTVYLTFDDGPGKYTEQVLDILKRYQVQATFFVLGQHAERSPEQIRRIVEEGHALGNHTYNHNYKELYGDFRTFWKQIKQTEEIIYEIAGYRPQLVRAPGGSYGHFDKVYFDLLQQGGYNVVDWNVDSGDSKHAGVPAAQIEAGAVRTDGHVGDKVVLLHDGGVREETVKALPGIIKKYRSAGYSFDVLRPDQTQWKSPVKKMTDSNSKNTPDERWIAEYVLPNKTLLLSGKPLVLEFGRLKTSLAFGEYEWNEGRIVVSLRTAVQRLGGTVTWNSATKTASVAWNGRTVQVHADTERVTSCKDTNRCVSGASKFVMRAGVIRLPLRDLFQWAGHPVSQMRVTQAEYRVTTLQEEALPSLTSRIVVAYNESNN
ncbi:polysaccharide deacetylase [Paenibacillus sp. P96]|uniref:Polysaccharide deacetylase n=1 Tax=Paenibacillus zeirhizosphaerae TaxID=2987519 RepID=A0ABT9FUB9_9BACL|nr:polysaccharide deacetylase [Paenibacillus sp. P96]MDP4098324.1 polysaccharide deacetylase [Paenibacillus sp. P96]